MPVTPSGRIIGRSVGITIDGGTNVLTTGVKGYIWCPYAGNVQAWYVVADQAGSIVMDVWKVAGPAIPTGANSIVGADPPTLTAQQAASNTTLTLWTLPVSVGDMFGFSITSVSTIKRVTLVVRVDS
jgi:hypothetical protein